MPGSLGLPEKLLFQGKFSECADKEDSLRPLQIAAGGGGNKFACGKAKH